MKAHIILVATALATAAFTARADGEIIRVATDRTEMVLTVAPDGKLVYNYYGRKFDNVDPFLTKKYFEIPDNGSGYAPQAYPAFGERVTINPALKLCHADGGQTTQLRYRSHSATDLPDGARRTDIVLGDSLYDVTVTLSLTAYPKEDVITESATVANREKGPVAVETVASGYLPLHANSYWLTHFNGVWADEMHLVEEQLRPGIKSVESKRGIQTTQIANPAFLLALDGPAREDEGEVYAGILAWSGNYKHTFEVDECLSLNVVSGINDFASTYTLGRGESFTTPEMVWSYSDRGRGQISRNLHDWMRRHRLAHADQERPVVLNSWEGAYMDFDEAKILRMIDDAADFGVEMFVLDDGWFGLGDYARNADNAGLGDWQVNTAKLPNGIDTLASHAVARGMRFGIWIEPEMVNPRSRLAHEHPEWIVGAKGRERLTMRNQWVLDLTNPEVQDFIVRTFDDVVALSPHISYVKWDANRSITDFGSNYLPADRQQHFWVDYIRGLYSVYERIRRAHPDIMIQLCSSGGARLDPEALRYHDEFWASDNTNAPSRIRIQNATNIFYPAMATGAHVSTAPNHQTGMTTPLKYRFDVAMSGRLGLELQPAQLDSADRAYAARAIATYKQIRPIVQMGDLYRLENPDDGTGWTALEYVAKDRARAVVFVYSTDYHGRTTYFHTRLKGLDPAATYRVTELNAPGTPTAPQHGRTYPADYLLNAGITLPATEAHASTVLLLEKL